MVKFQKQLEEQLVPEWRNAYVNYKQLKRLVRQIRQQIVREQQASNAAHGGQYRPIFNIYTKRARDEDSLVVHHRVQPDDLLGQEAEELYATELCGPLPWLEDEDRFFSLLDSQLNMVNNFYKVKAREFILQSEQLEVQLETLVGIRGELAACEIDDEGDFEKEVDIESGDNGDTKYTMNNMENITFCMSRIKSNACVMNSMENTPFCMRRNKIKAGRAEKMLRSAFVEHYKGLTLLQNYSSLNTLAFAKILKKFDKVTGKNVMHTYLRVIEASYFSTSNKVMRLAEKVEDLFTKHFSKNNRREALVRLRPSSQLDSKMTTFNLGIFTGWSWSLLLSLVLVLLTHSQIAEYLGSPKFAISVYLTFSIFAMIIFHLYIWGLDLYLWKRTRINYSFIFEFAVSTELRSLEVMLISTGLTAIFMTCILFHLVLVISKFSFFAREVEIIPVTSLITFLLFVISPFNICYKETRYYFLRCFWHIICSPFYKVKFADFFLADQLTSQITVLRNVANISCYYVSHYYSGSSDVCSKSHVIQYFKLFMAVLPYWWRLLQCGRRWRDDPKDRIQIANAGKYLSALTAVLIRLIYGTNKTNLCFILYIVSSTIATIYQFHWDVVVDWGLLRRNSVNPWLRDQLILKSKVSYFVAMVANALLRLVWIYSLVHEIVRFEPFDHKHLDLIFGIAEIARRGMWSFFRLENEHLNNVGKFRAVKAVPLPFKDIDQ